MRLTVTLVLAEDRPFEAFAAGASALEALAKTIRDTRFTEATAADKNGAAIATWKFSAPKAPKKKKGA